MQLDNDKNNFASMVFYFSGTGNTKWVAQQLASATGESLRNIADELRQNACQYALKAGERLGFCFPTHGWQPPHIVREFIRRSSFSVPHSAFVYAVTTCGDNMGEAMSILNKELAGKGLAAQTQFSVIMPESYVCLPFMYTDSAEREAEKISQARQQLEHIINVVCERRRGIVELEKGAIPRLYSYVIGGYFNKHMITDSKFMVDENVCTHCGKCAKICPVSNITGTPPKWLHNEQCTCCLACYHHCPVHAINYGNITRKRGQYHFKG